MRTEGYEAANSKLIEENLTEDKEVDMMDDRQEGAQTEGKELTDGKLGLLKHTSSLVDLTKLLQLAL